MQFNTKFSNGDLVKDKVTGFTGVVVCTTIFLNGCIRHSVQCQTLKEGKRNDPESFDEHDLTLVNAAEVEPVIPRKTGGPQDHESIATQQY